MSIGGGQWGGDEGVGVWKRGGGRGGEGGTVVYNDVRH